MSTTATGVDLRGDRLMVAVTEADSGRVRITALRHELEAEETTEESPAAPVRVAVPEALACIKALRIEAEPESTAETRARFELVASMLDDDKQFLTAVCATGRDERFLGMLLRRERAAELWSAVSGRSDFESDRVSFQLRGVGLGRGYLAFCRRADAELIGLVDLAGATASIVLIHAHNIVDVTSLALETFDLDSDSGRDRMAVDLKTIINFRQIALAEAGISVPLSSLVLLGEPVDDDLRQIVQTYFPVGVRGPELLDGFLDDFELPSDTRTELFLAALGLAVN